MFDSGFPKIGNFNNYHNNRALQIMEFTFEILILSLQKFDCNQY